LSENVITSNSTVFDPGWWQLPNSKKRYRDWKRWGHGKLNVQPEIADCILEDLHNLYGHPGSKKMIKLIQEYLTFDRMTKKV
ncbi:MAG: hypothetical protein ACTS8Y_03190, partial [Arsenophonus sp. ER-EMS1-MAG3]